MAKKKKKRNTNKGKANPKVSKAMNGPPSEGCPYCGMTVKQMTKKGMTQAGRNAHLKYCDKNPANKKKKKKKKKIRKVKHAKKDSKTCPTCLTPASRFKSAQGFSVHKTLCKRKADKLAKENGITEDAPTRPSKPKKKSSTRGYDPFTILNLSGKKKDITVLEYKLNGPLTYSEGKALISLVQSGAFREVGVLRLLYKEKHLTHRCSFMDMHLFDAGIRETANVLSYLIMLLEEDESTMMRQWVIEKKS